MVRENPEKTAESGRDGIFRTIQEQRDEQVLQGLCGSAESECKGKINKPEE